MKLPLTLGLVVGLLFSGAVACTPSERPQKSKSVIGDIEPFELRPTAIFAQPKTAVSRRLDALSGDHVFVPSRFGETQISTAMTHWLAPGTLNDSFSLKVGPSQETVVRICIFATPDREKALFDGLELMDATGKAVGVETDAYTDPTSTEPNSIYPQRDFLLGPKSFKNLSGIEPENFVVKFPIAARDYLIRVSVFEPSSTMSFGAGVEAQAYQPGDTVKVAFELFDGAASDMKLERIDLQLEIGQVEIASPGEIIMNGNRRGVAQITIPGLAQAGRARLTLIATGRVKEKTFKRSTRVHFDVVRPHAEIFDLKQRMGKGMGGPQFEVDVTVRSMNSDRFRVFGVLTGRTRSGYEIPVARAQAVFDGVEGGLTTTSLIFELAAVRDSVLIGPFSLRDVVLESTYTGTVQHRIGLVDGVETPQRWGLAGNQALNDAMCEILAEAGRLPRDECAAD